MSPEPIPTWCFVKVVVAHEGKFLLIHERSLAYDQHWYLPAGKVERNETFPQAAIRETREEAGVVPRIIGVLRVEHAPGPDGARLGVVFLAVPDGDPTPKSEPDSESLGAGWFSLDELASVRLGGDGEVVDVLRHVAAGGPVFPLAVLQFERQPYGSSVEVAGDFE